MPPEQKWVSLQPSHVFFPPRFVAFSTLLFHMGVHNRGSSLLYGGILTTWVQLIDGWPYSNMKGYSPFGSETSLPFLKCRGEGLVIPKGQRPCRTENGAAFCFVEGKASCLLRTIVAVRSLVPRDSPGSWGFSEYNCTECALSGSVSSNQTCRFEEQCRCVFCHMTAQCSGTLPEELHKLFSVYPG